MKSARCMEYLIDQFHLDDVIQYKEQNALISSNEDATVIVIFQKLQIEHYEDVDGRMQLIFQQELYQFKNTLFNRKYDIPTRLALNQKGDILLIEIHKTKFNLYYKKAQLQQWTHFYSNCTVQNISNYRFNSILKSFNSQFSCFLLQIQSTPKTIVLSIINTPQTKKLIQSLIQVTDCILNEDNNIILGRESNQLHFYKQKKVIPFQKINLPNGLLYAKFDQLNNLILLTKAHLEIYFQQLGQTYQKIAGIPIINNNQICNIVPIDAYIIIQRTYLGAEFAQVCQIEEGAIQLVGKIICRQIITSSSRSFYLVIKDKQIEIYRHN
ncbi:unnamed protein product [Paramecium octaurelia]|uniref:Uncharacterized protein n=1 Tax=Paramecium octaurelia TaxID=43137 RepID=A0A8S1S804_PAROT|nr:unnamed protein product [Paramecium octaurelia]